MSWSKDALNLINMQLSTHYQTVVQRALAKHSVNTITTEIQIKTILTSLGVSEPPRFQAYARFIQINTPRQQSNNFIVPLKRRND
mmetsp:Transcript_16389/g.24512  ORF Transcript_16389/g.24512 Transcript_16389/m.24512 type:complete len:85 (-) Transcript_16389:413-667(-)